MRRSYSPKPAPEQPCKHCGNWRDEHEGMFELCPPIHDTRVFQPNPDREV